MSLTSSIDLMVEQGRFLPALILIYAGIDAVASLERRGTEGSKAAFVRWADAFMVGSRRLPCTAVELYAARCGILHAFTADSDLSRSRRARRVIYTKGDSLPVDLSTAVRRLKVPEVVVVHLEDLRDAFQEGVLAFLEAIAGDEARLRRVAERAGEWMVDIEHGLLQEFLRRTDEQEG